MIETFHTFDMAIEQVRKDLLTVGQIVDTGSWQGISTEGHPDLQTVEITNVGFTCPMPAQGDDWEDVLTALRREIKPNLPWADEHFAERVGREPTNPGEAYKTWPWWRGQDEYTMNPFDHKFTHTYQERFWPDPSINGIRYPFGDLDDVVDQLRNQPHTRQAYLPIFFPEDTGAVHGGRVPCTLGYHFLIRQQSLHMWYFIRSCDFVRHFRDDLYLAARLQLWVRDELKDDDLVPGDFTFICPSMHYHRGDGHLV